MTQANKCYASGLTSIDKEVQPDLHYYNGTAHLMSKAGKL